MLVLRMGYLIRGERVMLDGMVATDKMWTMNDYGEERAPSYFRMYSGGP